MAQILLSICIGKYEPVSNRRKNIISIYLVFTPPTHSGFINVDCYSQSLANGAEEYMSAVILNTMLSLVGILNEHSSDDYDLTLSTGCATLPIPMDGDLKPLLAHHQSDVAIRFAQRTTRSAT